MRLVTSIQDHAAARSCGAAHLLSEIVDNAALQHALHLQHGTNPPLPLLRRCLQPRQRCLRHLLQVTPVQQRNGLRVGQLAVGAKTTCGEG